MDFAYPDFYVFGVKLGRSVFHRLIYIVSFVALKNGHIIKRKLTISFKSASEPPLRLKVASLLFGYPVISAFSFTPNSLPDSDWISRKPVI